MKYFWATIRHKRYVLLAGFKVGLPLWRSIVHDLSKFTKEELPHYDRQFFGDKGDPEGFAKAWKHHYKNNDHHPENYEVVIHYTSEDVTVYLPMSPVCVREMIADWMGASKAYTGSWDMTEWLKENLDKKDWHTDTAAEVLWLLKELGYSV